MRADEEEEKGWELALGGRAAVDVTPPSSSCCLLLLLLLHIFYLFAKILLKVFL